MEKEPDTKTEQNNEMTKMQSVIQQTSTTATAFVQTHSTLHRRKSLKVEVEGLEDTNLDYLTHLHSIFELVLSFHFQKVDHLILYLIV